MTGLSAVLAKAPRSVDDRLPGRYSARIRDVRHGRRILGRRPNGSIGRVGIIEVRRAGRRRAAPVDGVRLASWKIALSHIDRRRGGAGRGERRVLIVDVKSRVEILLDGVRVADREAHARIAVTCARGACDILRHAGRIVAAVRRIQPTEVAGADAVSVELELAPQESPDRRKQNKAPQSLARRSSIPRSLRRGCRRRWARPNRRSFRQNRRPRLRRLANALVEIFLRNDAGRMVDHVCGMIFTATYFASESPLATEPPMPSLAADRLE